MAALSLHKPWEEVKEMLKEINSSLTDEDLVYEQGKEDALLQHLSNKLNKTKEEVSAIIESASYNQGKAS